MNEHLKSSSAQGSTAIRKADGEPEFNLHLLRGERRLTVIDRSGNELGEVTVAPEVMERLLYAMDQTNKLYTMQQVAALVEETQSKSYDYLKREVLNFLEALLQIKGAGNTAVGNVVANILKGAQRVEMDIVQRLAPEITPELIEASREEREMAEAEKSRQSKVKRLRALQEEVGDLEADLRRDSRERQLDFWRDLPFRMSDAELEVAVNHMATWRPGEAELTAIRNKSNRT